jgi:acid phosphatase
MGWLWLNATTNLLLEGPETAGPLYFSFVHDGDMVPMLAALGLFEDEKNLPVDEIWEERRWKTSQITPMGGRILLERLKCGKERYVRFNVNDGIVPLQGCSDGPGASCGLAKFEEYVKRRGEQAGDFREVCGLPEDAAKGLTFLRQPGFGGPV